MHIEFKFSGGYGGLFTKKPRLLRLNTDDMPDDQRRELVELVRSSGLLDMEPSETQTGPQRDAFTYTLTIRDGGIAKTFPFDDATAPPGAHPLLAFLRKRAMDQGK